MRGKKAYYDSVTSNSANNIEDGQQLFNTLLNNNLLSNGLYPEFRTNSLDGNDNNDGDEDISQTTQNNLSLLEAINDIDQALTYEKRAPQGFVGMRGKRAPVGFMGKISSNLT